MFADIRLGELGTRSLLPVIGWMYRVGTKSSLLSGSIMVSDSFTQVVHNF